MGELAFAATRHGVNGQRYIVMDTVRPLASQAREACSEYFTHQMFAPLSGWAAAKKRGWRIAKVSIELLDASPAKSPKKGE